MILAGFDLDSYRPDFLAGSVLTWSDIAGYWLLGFFDGCCIDGHFYYRIHPCHHCVVFVGTVGYAPGADEYLPVLHMLVLDPTPSCVCGVGCSVSFHGCLPDVGLASDVDPVSDIVLAFDTGRAPVGGYGESCMTGVGCAPADRRAPVGSHVLADDHVPVGGHDPVGSFCGHCYNTVDGRVLVGGLVPVDDHAPVAGCASVDSHLSVNSLVPVDDHALAAGYCVDCYTTVARGVIAVYIPEKC